VPGSPSSAAYDTHPIALAAMATSAVMPPAADAAAAPSAADGDDATTPPPTNVITDSMRAEEAALQAASEREMQAMAQSVRRLHVCHRPEGRGPATLTSLRRGPN